MTGIMLAVARAAGETAPLLFTALFFDYWPKAPFLEPTASLAVLIYNFSGVPYPSQIGMAWEAALVLIVLILAVNIASQFALGRSQTHR
jgi:phosphate transport system permease protein